MLFVSIKEYAAALEKIWKTFCKYSLPLFFLVVQTNVNFQLAFVIVIEDESSDLLMFL